ncbi:MAG: RagB/SusD family nutrient uptake outer membrane protein [Bacteroidota bacterium]
MKKNVGVWLSLFWVLSISPTFTACEAVFDLNELPGKSQFVSLPYESLDELDLAVNGLYRQMHEIFRWNRGLAHAWSADDLTNGGCGCKATFREYDRREVHPENSSILLNWRGAYKAIRSANNVLRNAAESHLRNDSEKNRLMGEAYFIRAQLYHYLTRKHGRVPLVLDLEINREIELADQLEVYQQIEKDLLAAEALLPASSELGAIRPNTGSARAFLARLYLDWAGFPLKDNAKYAEAAVSAKQVIDNAHTHGFALVKNMASLYSLAGRRNPESVFALSYCEACAFGNRKYGKLGMPGDFGGWQESFAEIRFFEDFPEGHRKEATFHTEVPLDSNGKVSTDIANAVSFVPWTSFRGDQNPLYRKLVGPFEEGSFDKFNISRPDYVMRYAEVLLIYAEASARSGSVPPDAWEALNRVRRRAEGLNPSVANPDIDLNSGDLAELAYTERKWELAGEFLRWFDLTRMERVEEALGGSARDPRVSIGTRFNEDGTTTPIPISQPSIRIVGSLGTDNYFEPIPPSELEQLRNLGG